MFIEERHQEISEILKNNGKITVSEITQKFGISDESARRDLRLLEKRGVCKRTHGGAIPARQIAHSKPPRMTCKDITEVKKNYLEIAKKAVSMINQNDVVFILSATVGYFMVQNIPDSLHIRVVTNSTILAEELRQKENISTILLGGEMDAKGNFYDTFAIEMIKRLRFDKCFITSACISSKFGLSIQKSQAISFWNAVIDSSKTAIGLYPTEKIGFESIVSICPANRLDCIITDWDASEGDELQLFEESGIEIIKVEEPNE
ncbi:MAG: DeoR/GlpR transcriptional regulator [Clostridia bacterium]|nr:DeoR/GlpR transcriptional regulator [Clostridia bacterium]